MIQYYIKRRIGTRLPTFHIKYIDVWQPMDNEYSLSKQVAATEIVRIPNDHCQISKENVPELDNRIDDKIMRMSVGIIFETVPMQVFMGACEDQGLDDVKDYRIFALFIFWHYRNIQWDNRLFTQFNFRMNNGLPQTRGSFDSIIG